MIRIGEFSKLAKTTIKALRYYDDIGLFKPSFVDDNGYRYYEYEKLNELLKIIQLRKLDMPIDKIKDILDGKDKKEIIISHIKQLEIEKNQKESQITSLKELLKGEKKMEFKEKIKVIEPNIVFYKHGIIHSMENLTNFVLEAGSSCAILNPNLKCKDYCYITYTAKEYKEKDVELEYCQAVYEKGIEGNGVFFREDNKIKALTVEVKGPYSNLASAYAFILNKVKELNLEIVAPIREVYIHGCWDKESEEEYLTEIQVPIK